MQCSPKFSRETEAIISIKIQPHKKISRGLTDIIMEAKKSCRTSSLGCRSRKACDEQWVLVFKVSGSKM